MVWCGVQGSNKGPALYISSLLVGGALAGHCQLDIISPRMEHSLETSCDLYSREFYFIIGH